MGDDPAELAAIWAEHRAVTLGRVAALEAAALAVLDGSLDTAARAAARREAHTLAGSIAFFGLADAADKARQLEARYATDPPRDDAPLLAELAEAIRRAVEAPLPPQGAAIRRRILLAPGDGRLAARLRAAGAAGGTAIEHVSDPAAADRAVAAGLPDAAIVDLAFADATDRIRRLAAAGVPVIAIGAGGDAAMRVSAAAAGAPLYLDRESAPAVLLDAAVDAAARQQRLLGARVLVLDDDPSVPAALRERLGWYGAAVVACASPQDLWPALAAERPDLLVLDVEMPGANGAQLCAALRADPAWRTLPIVFLTATTDPATLRLLLGAGADDCVTKPAEAAVLADRLARVLERRGQRQVAERPAGTEVLVVDDDPVVADILLRALGGAGHRAEWIEDGVGAAEALAAPARAPRVALLDVDLPGLDGYAVLARAAAAGTLAVCRVIMLTARSSEAEIVRALELGAFDHIAKPFSVPVVLGRVRRALGS